MLTRTFKVYLVKVNKEIDTIKRIQRRGPHNELLQKKDIFTLRFASYIIGIQEDFFVQV